MSYQHTPEAVRYAPAFVCNIASRFARLRKHLADNAPDMLSRIRHEIEHPLSFEKELLSGDVLQVDAALASGKDGLVESLRAVQSDLPDGERFEIWSRLMDGYCCHCGRAETKYSRCHCWNDE